MNLNANINMKNVFLNFIILICLVACSDSDNMNSDDGMGEQLLELQQYVNSITNISQIGSTELRFIYDDQNRLIRNETDTYERIYQYSGDQVIQIKSTTLPNTPYYTIDYVYEGSQVVEVQRNNHYNGSIFYVTYAYDSSDRVNRVCVYNNITDYDNGECNRYYDLSYVGDSKNYVNKDLSLDSLNGSEFLEISNWSYDMHERPYFGDAIANIRLPYATDGTGMDYEFIYNTNNPVSKNILDFNSSEFKLRKQYSYLYNADSRPTQMEIKTYDIITGLEVNTFTQQFSYVDR